MAVNSSFIVAFLKHPVSPCFLRLGSNIAATACVYVKLKTGNTHTQPYVVTVLLKYFLVVPHTDVRGN